MRNPGNGITDTAGPLKARAPVRGMEPVETAPRGRRCADPGCPTTLSVYNRGHHCWQHEPRRPFTLQAPRGEPIQINDDEILASVSGAQVRTHRASA